MVTRDGGGVEVERGQHLLDRLQLREAEEIFTRTYNQAANHTNHTNHTNHINNDIKLFENLNNLCQQADCLVGISNCRTKSFKLGRYLKDDFWLQCFVLPICFLHRSQQLYNKIIQLASETKQAATQSDPSNFLHNCYESRGQTGKSKNNHAPKDEILISDGSDAKYVLIFDDVRSKLKRLEFQISTLEENFIRGFLCKSFGAVATDVQSPLKNKKEVMNEHWLNELLHNCTYVQANNWTNNNNINNINNINNNINNNILKLTRPSGTKTRSPSQPPPAIRNHSFNHSDDTNLTIDPQSKQRPNSGHDSRSNNSSPTPPHAVVSRIARKTINFEKFQEAIQSFVSEISSQVRTKYGNLSRVPETMMEKRLNSEIILRLTPGTIQADDYISTLEEALVCGCDVTGPQPEDYDADVKNGEKMKGEDDDDEKVMEKFEMMVSQARRLVELDDDDDDEETNDYADDDDDDGDGKFKSDNRTTTKTMNGSIYETIVLDAEMIRKGNVMNHQPGQQQLQQRQQLQRLQQHLQQQDQQHLQTQTINLPDKIEKEFSRVNCTSNTSTTKHLLRTNAVKVLLQWKHANNLAEEMINSNEVDAKNDPTGTASLEKARWNLHNYFHSAFTELPDIHPNNNNSNNNIGNNDSSNSWPYIGLRESDIRTSLLELIVKAAEFESRNRQHDKSVRFLKFVESALTDLKPEFEKNDNNHPFSKNEDELIKSVWIRMGQELGKSGHVSEASEYIQKLETFSKQRQFIRQQQQTVELTRKLYLLNGIFESDVDSPSLNTDKNSSGISSVTSLLEKLEMWLKLGDAYLGDDVRSESLLARLMLLTKEEMMKRDGTVHVGITSNDKHSNILSLLRHSKHRDFDRNFNKAIKTELDADDEDNEEEGDGDDDEEKKKDGWKADVYLTCLHEAANCFNNAAKILRQHKQQILKERAELWTEVTIKLADCLVMVGSLDRAETVYDETLDHVRSVYGSDQLARNIHAILSLATLCFLAGNHVRAGTLVQMVLALRGLYSSRGMSHLNAAAVAAADDDDGGRDGINALMDEYDDVDFPTVWSLIILSFSHYHLQRPHLAASWFQRAFNAQSKFFRGRVVAVDPLNRWYSVRMLTCWSVCYISLSLPVEAIGKLTLAKKYLEISGKPDKYQLVSIFKILADSYWLLSFKPELNSTNEERDIEAEQRNDVDNDHCNNNEEQIKSSHERSNETKEEYQLRSQNFYRRSLECFADLFHDDERVEVMKKEINSFKKNLNYFSTNDIEQLEKQYHHVLQTQQQPHQPIISREDNMNTMTNILLELANEHVIDYNTDQALACFLEFSRELEREQQQLQQQKQQKLNYAHDDVSTYLLASVYFRLGRLFHVKFIQMQDDPEIFESVVSTSLSYFLSARQMAETILNDRSADMLDDITLSVSCLLYDSNKKYEALQNLIPLLFPASNHRRNDDHELTYPGVEVLSLQRHVRAFLGLTGHSRPISINRTLVVGLLGITCLKECHLGNEYLTEVMCSLVPVINKIESIDICRSFFSRIMAAFIFAELDLLDEASNMFLATAFNALKMEKNVEADYFLERIYSCRLGYLFLAAHLMRRFVSFVRDVLDVVFRDVQKKYRLLTYEQFCRRALKKILKPHAILPALPSPPTSSSLSSSSTFHNEASATNEVSLLAFHGDDSLDSGIHHHIAFSSSSSRSSSSNAPNVNESDVSFACADEVNSALKFDGGSKNNGPVPSNPARVQWGRSNNNIRDHISENSAALQRLQFDVVTSKSTKTVTNNATPNKTTTTTTTMLPNIITSNTTTTTTTSKPQISSSSFSSLQPKKVASFKIETGVKSKQTLEIPTRNLVARPAGDNPNSKINKMEIPKRFVQISVGCNNVCSTSGSSCSRSSDIDRSGSGSSSSNFKSSSPRGDDSSSSSNNVSSNRVFKVV